MWDKQTIEDNYPFFEIHFPNCSPLICIKDEIYDFIYEQFEYLEPGEEICIKISPLTQEELLELEEHQGC